MSTIAERKHERSDIVAFYRNGTERFCPFQKISISQRNVSIRSKIFEIELERFASLSKTCNIETELFSTYQAFQKRNGTFRLR